MGKFVIRTTATDFKFDLKAGNGQLILSSEVYTTKEACLKGIESVKKNASDDSKYERKESSNGKPMFNLKAGNGQIIGTSELYESEAGRDNGIESIKKNIVDAEVVEE